MRTKLFILLSLFAALLALSCGSQQKAESGFPGAMLPAEVDSLNLLRTTEVRIFVGDSLWEYINGGAELYHLYDFVQVATADYELSGTELVVDIYEFDSPDHAFGLYTMLRPEMIQTISLGVEAFDSPTNFVMVKGAYVMAITAFEQSDRVSQAITTAAELWSRLIPGTEERPGAFALLPDADAVAATETIYAESFLGQAALTEVYSRKYAANGDTLQLFVTDDQSGEKFLRWKEQIDAEKIPAGPQADISFDEGLSIKFTHSYYGEVVAGLKGGRLAGVIGYKQEVRDFTAGWINSLAPATP